MSRFQEFAADPFVYVDGLKLTFRGNNFNLFQKYKKVQTVALVAAFVFLVLWMIAGFDSTPMQLWEAVAQGIPALIRTGSAKTMIDVYNSLYGKEMHYSAFVIYFLLFWAGSKTWENAGITKSKNMIFSFAGMFLAIGIFEWFWILGFAFFQNQPWVATWKMPQMKILLQNTGFTFAGGMACIFMLTERWHWDGRIQGARAYYFNVKSWLLWLFVGLSIASALFWIYYPGQVTQITVRLANGQVWHSSRLFPQTLYTVDTNPLDNINAGVWFYVQNDAIHALNTVVKAIWAATVFLLFRVKVAGKLKILQEQNCLGEKHETEQ